MNDYTEQQRVTVQLEAIAPLVERAKTVFLANASLPELHPAQEAEANAREASIELAERILILDRDLRKSIGLL